MGKKSQSKPMKEILNRLEEFELIRTIVFPEEVILNEPVSKWPICDCLISFHSKGFPLAKAGERDFKFRPFSRHRFASSSSPTSDSYVENTFSLFVEQLNTRNYVVHLC